MREEELGNLLDVIIDHRGKTPKKLGGVDFTDAGVPVVSAIHIKNGRINWNERRRYVSQWMFEKWMPVRLRAGDVLLTSEAPLGEVAQVENDRDLVLSQRLFALRGKRGCLDSTYLRYFLQSGEGQQRLHNRASGTTVFGIRQAELVRVKVPVPPIQEQRRIAGVLRALDDVIDTNRRIAEDSTTLWRALVRNTVADASESVPLSELADFVNGKNFTRDASGHGRPVIRTPEVRRGPEAGTVRSDAEAQDENTARKGDTLFVWSGSLTVGRWMWEEGLINQHVFKVLPKPDVPAWLVFALIEYQMPWFLSLAADKATTMGHIKREHLDAMVPVPSSPEVERLDAIVEPMWDEALQCGIAAQDLTRARDELLPLLLSGRVRVQDVAA
jgi:type I restriction enzyme S subunit